jgi:hypothetical protein
MRQEGNHIITTNKKIQAKFDFDMLTLSVLGLWPFIMPIDTGFQVLRFLLTNSRNTQIKFEFGYYPFNGSRVMLLS